MIWKDLLALSRREQKGYFVLLSLIMILLIILLVMIGFSKWNQPTIKFSYIGYSTDSIKTSDKVNPKIETFNPNTVSIKQLELLGLNPRVILNWKKYLESNGQFHSPNDLYRLYSIDSAFVEKVTPYLVFNSNGSQNVVDHSYFAKSKSPQWVDLNDVTANQLAEMGFDDWRSDSILRWQSIYWFTQKVNASQLSSADENDFRTFILQYSSPKKAPIKVADSYSIEINQADTAELNLLDGIGPVIARRIVYYRKQLGGFYSLEQLQEVSGISPATMQKVKLHATVNVKLITPVNVNNASLRRLKEHPYLGYYKAKEIVEYRKTKGQFQSLEEVLQLNSFNNEQPDWVQYYLSL